MADITYVRMREEFAYLAVVLDAFSRRVVGWALEAHLNASLPISALKMAIAARRPRPGCLVHHSDRGVQYACGDHAVVLDAHGIVASMTPSRTKGSHRNVGEFAIGRTLFCRAVRAGNRIDRARRDA